MWHEEEANQQDNRFWQKKGFKRIFEPDKRFYFCYTCQIIFLFIQKCAYTDSIRKNCLIINWLHPLLLTLNHYTPVQ